MQPESTQSTTTHSQSIPPPDRIDRFPNHGFSGPPALTVKDRFFPPTASIDSSVSCDVANPATGCYRDDADMNNSGVFVDQMPSHIQQRGEHPLNMSIVVVEQPQIPLSNATANSTPDAIFPSLQMISKTNLSLESSRICGLPGFCKASAYDSCFNFSISTCDECSKPGSVFFILFVVCLGVAIVIGNLIILAVGWKRHKSGKASKMDACRCSLAIADLLTGKFS